MRNLRQRATRRWAAMGVTGRVWWAGAAAVGTAAVFVLGATSIVDASAHSTANDSSATAPVNTATAGNTGSMAGMSSGAKRSAGTSSASVTSKASPICYNVTGTTVMPNGMVMAPVPSGAPTPAEQTAADQLAANTKAALAQYANLSAATAAGYVPATNPKGYVVHYANWQTVKAGDVLDPSHPSSLVYANTVSAPVLLGAMFLGAGPCRPGPDVGGSLTQWHAHDNLCLSATHQVVGNTNATGTCTTGTHNTSTYFMLHVWIAPSLASTHQFQADLSRSEIALIIRTGQA